MHLLPVLKDQDYSKVDFSLMMGDTCTAIAMIYTAKPENRKEVAGFLGGVALVSLISGITEPTSYLVACFSYIT